jgi:hypothetical protein
MKEFDQEFVNTFKARFNAMNSKEQMEALVDLLTTMEFLAISTKGIIRDKQGERIIQENIQLIVGSSIFDNLLQLSCDCHNVTVLLRGDLNDITVDNDKLGSVRRSWKNYRNVWNRIFLSNEKKEKKGNVVYFRSKQ